MLSRFVTLLLIVAPMCAAGQTDPYQWVGATSVAFNGGGDDGTAPLPRGIIIMNAQCRADFGPGARMCSSLEILESTTINPNDIPVEGCWIRPTYQPVGPASSLNLVDVSGVAGGTSDPMTCGGWRGAGSGLSLLQLGAIVKSPCSEFRPVACCKPTPIPAPTSSLGLPIGTLGLVGLSMMKGGA